MIFKYYIIILINEKRRKNDLNNSKYNNQKSFKSNNKIIQFHQVFNLFKKEYKINEIKNKIKLNIWKN